MRYHNCDNLTTPVLLLAQMAGLLYLSCFESRQLFWATSRSVNKRVTFCFCVRNALRQKKQLNIGRRSMFSVRYVFRLKKQGTVNHIIHHKIGKLQWSEYSSRLSFKGWVEYIYIYIYIKVKVKWSRYRPGVAQRVGRVIALLFHDRGTRRAWVVSSTLQPHHHTPMYFNWLF